MASPEIREEMKEIAGKRRRFGYRRIGILLERKGMIMNHKKLYRLYREEGLSVKRRRGRKRARGSRMPMPEAAHPNARWSLDFLADSFGASRKFRILAVIDDCCRENLCLTADTSISGARVARELDALMRIYGKPACIVSDNGTEFTSRAILKWADKNGVPWHYIDPGKPVRDMPSSRASTAACATSCFCNRGVAVKRGRSRRFRLGSCFCPRSAWRCRTMVVEGEADHAKRRACGFARIAAQTLVRPSPHPRP